MKVKVKRHEGVDGHPIFAVSLPLECGECGYHFTREMQVGANDPIIPCPLWYCGNLLKLSWHLRRNKLSDDDIVEKMLKSDMLPPQGVGYPAAICRQYRSFSPFIIAFQLLIFSLAYSPLLIYMNRKTNFLPKFILSFWKSKYRSG